MSDNSLNLPQTNKVTGTFSVQDYMFYNNGICHRINNKLELNVSYDIPEYKLISKKQAINMMVSEYNKTINDYLFEKQFKILDKFMEQLKNILQKTDKISLEDISNIENCYMELKESFDLNLTPLSINTDKLVSMVRNLSDK